VEVNTLTQLEDPHASIGRDGPPLREAGHDAEAAGLEIDQRLVDLTQHGEGRGVRCGPGIEAGDVGGLRDAKRASAGDRVSAWCGTRGGGRQRGCARSEEQRDEEKSARGYPA